MPLQESCVFLSGRFASVVVIRHSARALHLGAGPEPSWSQQPAGGAVVLQTEERCSSWFKGSCVKPVLVAGGGGASSGLLKKPSCRLPAVVLAGRHTHQVPGRDSALFIF